MVSLRRLGGFLILGLAGLVAWSAWLTYRAGGWAALSALPGLWQARLEALIAPGLAGWALPSGLSLALAGLILRYLVFGRLYGAARRTLGCAFLSVLALGLIGLGVWFAAGRQIGALVVCVWVGVLLLGLALWRPRPSWRW